MAFSKKTYTSGQTAITADNLNAIQDELIRVGGAGTLPVADYVVEQGTSGSWTYRKWNSGIAECWCAVDDTLTYESQMLGGYIYYTGSYSYPLNFISAPTVSYNATFTSWRVAIIADASTNGTSGFGRVRILSDNGNLQGASVLVRIHAIGRWK